MTFKKEDIQHTHYLDCDKESPIGNTLLPYDVFEVKKVLEEMEDLKKKIEANMYVGFIGSIDVKNVIRILSNIEKVFDDLVKDIK